ncbi:MAG: hypothetical protein PHZ00_03000 [Candidatus Peribacteraceae bacterium]|nr:hypothetical protein [Candidatus Peribacteraceae bacterium]
MISDSSPLTKADGKHILDVIDQVLARLDSLAEELRVEMLASEQQIKTDFQRGIQIVREEVVDAHKDRFAQQQDRLDDHDRRLVLLEGASARL